MKLLVRFVQFGLPVLALAAIAGCAPDYSPNTYSANAVQQANKVEVGIVVGFREVKISDNGTVGAVTGGAAGGILGSEADVTGVGKALTTLGGTVVGGIVGTTIEHATGDTTGWEYIVRKPNGDMLSVTQREPHPLPIGQKVLVITGNQARIVPDYAAAIEPPADKDAAKDKDKTADKDKADKDKTADKDKAADKGQTDASGAKQTPQAAAPAPVAASTPSPAEPASPATQNASSATAATPSPTPVSAVADSPAAPASSASSPPASASASPASALSSPAPASASETAAPASSAPAATGTQPDAAPSSRSLN